MKIIDIDLDGVVAVLEKGKNQYSLFNITPLKGRPVNFRLYFIKKAVRI